jgi:hypothetical protein
MTYLTTDPDTHRPYIPTKQRSAREQQAAGVSLPYFVDDLDGLVNYNLTLAVLSPENLDKLVLLCRKYAAKVCSNPLDNRHTLDYQVTDRERHGFLRHCGLNRTPGNMHTMSGYLGGYDSIIHRINKKGVDVEQRVLQFKKHVALLIAATYPNLALESEYLIWRITK